MHKRHLKESKPEYEPPAKSRQDMSFMERMQIAIELGVIVDPRSEEGHRLLEDLDHRISLAHRKLPSSPLGEYPRNLLGPVSSSRFGWLFETLNPLSDEAIYRCFGEKGLEIIRAFRWTFIARQARSEAYMRKREVGLLEGTQRRRRRRIGDGLRSKKPFYTPEVMGMTAGFASELAREHWG